MISIIQTREENILTSLFSTGSALEELNLDEPLNIAASLDRELEAENNSLSNSISTGLASSGKQHSQVHEGEWVRY